MLLLFTATSMLRLRVLTASAALGAVTGETSFSCGAVAVKLFVPFVSLIVKVGLPS